MTLPASDRREAKRYSLQVDVQYMALDSRNRPQVGTGRSRNMSNSGLLFCPGSPLPENCRSCAAVLKWPAQPQTSGPPLLLFVLGHPVRYNGSEIAISVAHHAFLRSDSDTASIESLLSGIQLGRSAASTFRRRLQRHSPTPAIENPQALSQ
jgi:hypothetical protein